MALNITIPATINDNAASPFDLYVDQPETEHSEALINSNGWGIGASEFCDIVKAATGINDINLITD